MSATVTDVDTVAPVVIDFDAIFDAFVAANQKTWDHDRQQSLGASENYDCIRKGFFQKRGEELGFAPDEDFEEDWGAMERGNLYEEHHIAPAIKQYLPKSMPEDIRGDVQVLYTAVDGQKTLKNGRASATPDGLITGLPKNCAVRILAPRHGIDVTIPNIRSSELVLEFKSIDPRANLVEERTKHHNQTQMQLGLFNATTEFKPQFSIVLYVNASFISQVTPFVVEYDPEIYSGGLERAAAIWEHNDPQAFMPEGRFSGACAHCRWKMACGTATRSSIPEYDTDRNATPETIAEVDGLVRDAMSKKGAFEESERAYEMAKEKIKDFMLSRNSRKYSGPGWSVSWYGQDGKKKIDMAALSEALESAGRSLEEFESRGADFDVLRITPKLEGAEKKPRKSKKKDGTE